MPGKHLVARQDRKAKLPFQRRKGRQRAQVGAGQEQGLDRRLGGHPQGGTAKAAGTDAGDTRLFRDLEAGKGRGLDPFSGMATAAEP